MHDSVTVHMHAPPDEVWDLVSDVTRIGSYSPETFEAEWLEGATGPAVGAKFRGHVKRNGKGPTYWTTCVVTDCVPGAEFAFDVLRGTGPSTRGATGSRRRRRVRRHRVLPAAPTRCPCSSTGRLLGWARGRTNRAACEPPSRPSGPRSSAPAA